MNEHRTGHGHEGTGVGAGAGASEAEALARSFEVYRPRLRAVAYRVLGSAAEAEDAVQEAWFRLSRTDAGRVENLGSWLTTVVGRVCLDMLRSRRSRAEEPLESGPPVAVADAGPEQDALLADSVGVALLVVLETLTPAERLAFVLHDLFAVPFEEVAGVLGRTPAAARQLASRARRRVQGAPLPGADLARQRKVVEAFLAATRDGDFEGLLAVLDPDVVARSAAGVTTGAERVVAGATRFPHLAHLTHVALVDGTPGLVMLVDGRPERVLAFTFVHDRIAAIDIVIAPDDRLSRLTVTPV
ncbi:sigma-70 family RNA polymerase sigma factor [Streptomyces sp. NPDC002514]|uniref:sigma-70 family RNA polymerase sigma factor n=1 Tax=Streptomyces sp. NPDC001270 TaxID=3364554 RepID=UPI00367D54F5